jgi:hypothetical protein
MDKRYQLRQSALKNTVSQAESILAGTSDRIAKAKVLAGQIDGTENLKDAQDLTNVFLAEIDVALNELLKLTAHMAESQGLLDYTGVDDGVMASRVEDIEKREERSKAIGLEMKEALKKAGDFYLNESI